MKLVHYHNGEPVITVTYSYDNHKLHYEAQANPGLDQISFYFWAGLALMWTHDDPINMIRSRTESGMIRAAKKADRELKTYIKSSSQQYMRALKRRNGK